LGLGGCVGDFGSVFLGEGVWGGLIFFFLGGGGRGGGSRGLNRWK